MSQMVSIPQTASNQHQDTFKPNLNQPSLERVVPANKPKEFIGAIE